MLALHILIIPAWSGPQHWGSGYPYLAVMRKIDTLGNMELMVYEPPLRAKNATWISRWTNRDSNYKNAIPGGVVVGNFWPGDFGKDYLVVLYQNLTQLSIKVFEPPEFFTTKNWSNVSSKNLSIVNCLAATAGDLLGQGRDQLILLLQDTLGLKVAILSPPSSPTSNVWAITSQVQLPSISGSVRGFACGDFWGEKIDRLAIASTNSGNTKLDFFRLVGSAVELIVSDTAGDLPQLAQNGLVAADYTRDGFDVLTFVNADPTKGFELRVAPARSPDEKPNPGPTYTGKALSGQWFPGAGGSATKVVMTGRFDANASTFPHAVASGRIFGYIKDDHDFMTRYPYDARPDVEIAFTHRIPTKGERPPYGWPAKNETITYEINLKNNGQTTIPNGSAKLRVWINTPYRNADIHPSTSGSPDFVLPVNQDIPPFDPNNPSYVKVTVNATWPYDLITASPGATWKKLNIEEVGERWLVVALDCTGDTNLRNNRYEAALHAMTFHPVFRYNSTLADRQPTVLGDPCSKEYLSRKLADAVTCTWERSRTTNNEDVLQRVFFDGYEIGWPDDLPEPQRTELWQEIQNQYEGWRELEGWWGVGQGWERFNWDYSGELHETGHLFHPLGDLYWYGVLPFWTGTAKMADGTPVQFNTYMWGPELFGSYSPAVMGPPACEMMKRCLVGVRNAYIGGWESLAPDRMYVRVVDRNGNPVSGADISLWRYRDSAPYATGLTNADGQWDITYLFGSSEVDQFGRRHYDNGSLIHALAQIFTVKIGNYQDAIIWGMEDIFSHSRLTRMYYSFVNENEWTWDFRTNYDPLAPEPSFTLETAVEARKVKLGIQGTAGATYRLYRRWEPAYIRTHIGDFTAQDNALTILQDMAEPDSRCRGRYRAIYEVTEVVGDTESLPRSVAVIGLLNARGVTTQADGKLLVAANNGDANPFCILFNGTTPYQEYLYHFRFGHTANKVVPSLLSPGRYYATLAFSDYDPDYRFDLIPSPPGGGGYDVRNDLGRFLAIEYSTTSPYTIKLTSAQTASAFKPNDGVGYSSSAWWGPSEWGIVQQVSEDTLTVDKLIFPPGLDEPWLTGIRLAGRPGSDASLRELQDALGLATILKNGKEYVVIADTGNSRIVVWDDTTGYVTHWQWQANGLILTPTADIVRPAAVAAHPTEQGKFFVLDRQSDRQSKLYSFSFNGTTLQLESGYPVNIDVGDYSLVCGGGEIGLAAAVDPSNGKLILAITDAQQGRVLELMQSEQGWQTVATYTKPIGVFAGSDILSHPHDVAYVAEKCTFKLFALDDAQRVVLLNQKNIVRPDLVTSDIKFYKPNSPELPENEVTPEIGKLVTCKAILTNKGCSDTGIFNVKWNLDGKQVGYGSHKNLVPGATSDDNVRFDWTPTNWGVHSLEFIADVDNHVSELDEQNNTITKEITPLDTTPPTTPGTPTLSSGTNPNNTGTYSLCWTASTDSGGSGLKEYLLERSNSTCKGDMCFRIRQKFPVPTNNFAENSLSEGNYDYLVIAIDNAGNISDPSGSLTVVVDKTPPTGTILINNNATYTNTTSVTLNLSAQDTLSGLNQMQFSNNGTTWSTAEAYATKKAWVLTTGDGKKTVYVKFSDKAGNWSQAYSDNIILDTTKPTITSILDSPDPFYTKLGQVSKISYTLADNLSSSLEVYVYVYTYTGSLVRTLGPYKQALGSNSTTWDGKDSKGAYVTNSFYKYQIKATDQAGNSTTSSYYYVTKM
jgi:hypothetical protein